MSRATRRPRAAKKPKASRRSSRTPRRTRAAVGFEGVTPVLRVRSLAASLRHYIVVLGFKQDWGDADSGFASVSRDRCHLFLAQGDQGHPGSWVWIGVTDVEKLHAEYRRRGAKIRHPPTNYFWALEMQVEDPDGNVLRMGSEPREGEPDGEWLDMERRRWVRDGENGRWTRLGRG